MDVVCGIAGQSFPPKPQWGIDQIPDLSGKVVIVTGGNSGVGKETCKALLTKNAKVYMASRSRDRAMIAIEELRGATGKEAIFLLLDLASLASVESAVKTFKSQEKHLHILFNNGGVMIPPIEQLTTEGYDLQFGTNVLGHWYFTRLLISMLQATSKASPDGHARIIITSSSTALFTTTIDWDTLRDTPARNKLGTRALYAQSKFGNVVVAQELARRYGGEGIVTSSVNPGNLKTDLQRYQTGVQKWFTELLLHPAPLGALTQLYAGTSPEGADFNGKYLIPWARHGRIPKGADDPELGNKLWEWLEEQVKDREAARA
ncbi:hypothetical protein BOTBODRAFT_162426 [Botryobasidium botryosum FD-172 SS1]|uniref:NAD(P)-binding protein n=1 Tax=Botryobasidium botryosum (strain FD-172 SS1) TaxID=930990 RepID=A0A067MJR4_BOTB1|nr:hypothetical protein BOTBODRAFT_162426 [Botryobasidium botryosum FD-172 SS1]